MSNFRYRLREATKLLAVGENDVKIRLMNACTQHLFLANLPKDPEVLKYFDSKIEEMQVELTKKKWFEDKDNDRLRATLHRMHRKTASKYAATIWALYQEYEKYLKTGVLPTDENS